MNKDFNPLVSIIIPVYNGSKYLKQAIDSALNQTYNNVEIIVVDDGSTDQTKSIAKSYGEKISYYSKKNGGVATALNFGIDKMNGEYFSWLSHDDVYHKDKIKVQIERLSKLKDKTTLITCSYSRIDEFGNAISDNDFQRYKVEISKYSDEQLKTPLYALLVGGCIFGCGLLIHKSHFNRVGKFDSALLTNDYDLWFRMMRNNELIFIKEPLAYKRIHIEQDTNTKREYISAAWFSYFIHAVNNLNDDEFNKIYKSRKWFYNYVKDNIGLDKSVLQKVFNAQTRDEKFYLILKEKFNTTNCNESLNQEITNLKNKIQEYESSTCWKITKPLRKLKIIFRKKNN